MPPKKEQNPDPLELSGLEPDVIQLSVEERKVTKGNIKSKEALDVERQREERLSTKEKRLSMEARTEAVAARADASSAAPPVEEKSALLDKLYAYRERFPHLKARNKVDAKSSVEVIKDEIHYLELQLGSTNATGSIGSHILHGAMAGVEHVTTYYFNPLNLNLRGLGRVTKENMSEFEPIVDELMIKYGAGTYMPPEYRLILTIGATVFTVHAANTGDPAVGHALNKMSAAAKSVATDL
jgi:hypothetical protein